MCIKKNLTATMLLALALVLLVQGCSTIHGAGQDIEKAGEAIQRSAE